MESDEAAVERIEHVKTAAPRESWAAVLTAVDRAVGWGTEVTVAVLLVAELVILFVGIIARYVLQRSMVWNDEISVLLFLWLGAIGTVVALRHHTHMRLTVVLRRAPPRVAEVLELGATMVVAVFALEMIYPTSQLVAQQMMLTTPQLQLPVGWQSLAMFVGLIMLLVVSVIRMATTASVRSLLIATLIAAAAAGALVAVKPLLLHLGNANLLLFFVLLVGAGVVAGVPIAFVFGIATLSYLAGATNFPLQVVVGRMADGMSNPILLTIPLFVLLGLLMELTGIAAALVNFFASLVGHIRGGLNYVLLAAMYTVSGISGAKAADMAAVAPVLLPEMERRGAPRGELVALLSSSAAMSETIPPSLVLIVIGSVTSVSIAALFTAGLLPALVAALALALVAFIRSKNERDDARTRPTLEQIGRTFLVAIPGLILPFVIRGFVVGGIATATEVSTVGILYTIVVGVLVYRQWDWGRIFPILVETASLSGAILLVIATATAMSWALTQSGFSRHLVSMMAGVPGGGMVFLLVSICVFIALGSILEGIPALVLLGPLLFPVAASLGVSEVHYAIVAILAMGLGLYAPPFGVGFYTACTIGRVSPDAAIRPVIPYLVALGAAIVLVALIPWLSLGFLPSR